jgi:hypothetical protein
MRCPFYDNAASLFQDPSANVFPGSHLHAFREAPEEEITGPG